MAKQDTNTKKGSNDSLTIKKATSDRKIPPWGRKESHITKGLDNDYGVGGYTDDPVFMGTPEDFLPDAPIGTNQPTVAYGVMTGGMPNWNRMARGRLQTLKGKYRNKAMVY